jgi:heptaprenyl diphosphate synthase
MTHCEAFRIKRRELYQRLFSSRDLCVAGLLMMPAFLFNPYTELRILQCLIFWLFAWLAGKKNNIFMTLTIMLGIIVFNLFVPYGEEIFRVGRFRVTEGALWGGIHRAVTLEGLIMLSRVCVRADLKLPGKFGALIGESFRMLEQINERKGMISRKNIIGGIDQLMIELSSDDEDLSAEKKVLTQKQSPIGIIMLIIACALIWSIMILPFLIPALLLI